MGFGSYDETEQRDQDVGDEDEDAVVHVHGDEFEGKMTVDTDSSTDDLIGQLQEMKGENGE